MQILCQRVEKGRERQSVGQQDPGSFTSACLSLCSPALRPALGSFAYCHPLENIDMSKGVIRLGTD